MLSISLNEVHRVLIILRESRLQNYQPRFKALLYPFIQIVGIFGFGFLIFEVGKEALLISFAFISSGLFIYWFYGRIRTNSEYALLHLTERITAKELTDYRLETELREIIRERDNITKDRFDDVIENSIVMDIDKSIAMEEFFGLVDNAMAEKLGMESNSIKELLLKRERETTTVLNPYLAIPHVIIEGEGKFDILLARCKDGIVFSGDAPKVHAAFVLIGTRDERTFHLHSLAVIARIVQEPDFEEKWMKAKNEKALLDIILLGQCKRQ